MKKNLRYLFLILFLAFTAFIFINSFKEADLSSEQSAPYVIFVKNILNFLNPQNTVSEETITFYVRKIAHFAEFFIQAALLSGYFILRRDRFLGIYVLFTGLFSACIDEYIQLFPAGRSSQVSDVFVDFWGCAAAVVIYACLLYYLKKRGKNIWNFNG